mgnify:CR=1 FL=1
MLSNCTKKGGSCCSPSTPPAVLKCFSSALSSDWAGKGRWFLKVVTGMKWIFEGSGMGIFSVVEEWGESLFVFRVVWCGVPSSSTGISISFASMAASSSAWSCLSFSSPRFSRWHEFSKVTHSEFREKTSNLCSYTCRFIVGQFLSSCLGRMSSNKGKGLIQKIALSRNKISFLVLFNTTKKSQLNRDKYYLPL